ncbi:putative methylase/helicase [Novosphingobium aromaticivorans DSM 12444]|uniref:Putative methylase/helicase n=1 Tax=Novosphingobium aromaticivorans (strain ATCC 700278 / DSM 12444 / CCUG 56034 / CIP 105152 / NBRC 16084 / F199) TaxID=279238 RepID=Q2G677_NOVAD|nr:strawberry notch family protein [Novosphingobium aromaticivorans]ABD26646.1 putative methylase/helicase [Novosphingobium aromaticivorans DSM 12444]SCY38034.1 Methyltransferase domain-containing protein [Novosphingobium aromaticivorans]
MSNSSLAFAFDPPSPPLVVTAANAMALQLAAGSALSRSDINRIMTDHFGGTDALGAWSVRDAHAALELAQVQHLQASDQVQPTSPIDEAEQFFCGLDARIPTQTNRSDEQIEWQQFATPPRLAWLAARACAMGGDELALEPSAGTGMLAVWAVKAGARLALNEISPLRRDCLTAVFPAARVTGHDAELIDELLDPAISPSVVLMNPPYSHGIERGHDSRAGSRHLRSAWNRLASGGRLVAIMPEWFDCAKFLAWLKGPISLRLNAAVERAFVKQGTGITTRLLVFDKVEGSNEPVAIRTNDFRQLVDIVDALPDRAILDAVPEQSSLPARAPFRLVAVPRRPLPTPARITPPASAIGSLTYQSLETPARLAPQVGHYLPYRPSRIVIDGAAEHPTPLVESVAMGSIAAPKPDAVPQLPDGLIAKGLLSNAQAETLIYAASAHGRDLPGRFEPEDKGCSLKASAEGHTYRQGYFLGDGTGAGKGRQVASVILDRWVHGERRHIWISKNEALLEDARRDWAALGGLPIDIQPLASWKLGTSIAMRDGILFVTYPTLRSGRSDATRLDQILAWAGEDFDGVIVFDEAHAMANAAGGEGSRGKVKGSEQGIAGVRLQNLLPRARVLYASATGASDVNNLAYATRLGLWGPETAFANRETFVADIRDGGIAAMELVARDLKSLGLYTARALSFAGVEYEILEHCLTEDQIAVYDAYAEAWAIIHANLRDALEATRIVDSETGGTLNSGAKSAALSIFEGTKQRFFAQLLLSMKLPSLLLAIDTAIADGHAVVVQLVSTAEAMLNRRLADLSDEEREALEIDLSPREYVIDYLAKSFPVRLMAVFTDENGNPRSEPMSDEQGAPVLCRSALAARDRMIEQLCALPPIATALDAIIERFGVDQVAEVTGRTRRLIVGRDGRQKLQSRSPRANVAETQAFMDGAKRILVFSDAGGTGRSYHADLAAKNQARRVHFLLEPGWRADAAIQGLGRTNRTNQASAPLFRPVTTDVRGERRFISTIARRLDSLGALTRGQRQTGGQNLFDPADNLESIYAKEALHRWFGLLFTGKLEAVSLERFQELTGLWIEAPDGSMVDDLPSIQRWFNRILALPIALQNAIFDEFMGLVEARIDAARQAGTLDLGLETIAVEDFTVLSDTLLRTDPASGATTHLLELEIARALKPLTLTRLEELHGLAGQRQRPVRNARSGRVALLVPARSILADDGKRVSRFELLRPLKRSHITEDQLAESSWEAISVDAFRQAWAAEVEEARTSHKRERLYLAAGLLLPVWDKLPSDFVRVSRISAADGRSLLGREVPLHCVPDLCRTLGLEREQTLSADDIVQTVLATGRAMEFAGREQLMVKRSLVNGSQRIELTGWSAGRLDWYKAQGCFTEIIRYQTRLFVPIEGAVSVIARLASSA